MIILKEFREQLESEKDLFDSHESEGEGCCGCFIAVSYTHLRAHETS